MEKSDFVKPNNDTETISINRLKNKNFVPPLKIFNIRYFKTCNRIILIFLFLLILINTVICDIIQENNSKKIVNHESVGNNRRLVNKRSGIDIFLNKSSNRHNQNSNNSSHTNLCMKDHHHQHHRIKERDIKEEENGKQQKKKNYRNNEKEKKDEDDVSASLNAKNEEQLKMGNKGCNSCIMRDEIRTMSLEMIKGDILSKLGMAQAPNLTGKIMPKIGEYQLTLLKQKFALDSRQKNSYPTRRHSYNGHNKIAWVSEEDENNQMQGDEPYDSDSSDKVNSKNSDFSNKSNVLRSHGNASDNKYSDTSQFQEGEVIMEEEDDYYVRTEKIVAFSQPYPNPRIRHAPHIQYFQFSEKVRNNRVKKVLLWFYIKGRKNSNVGNKISVSIYKIVDSGLKSGNSRESPVTTPVVKDLVANIPSHSRSGRWINVESHQLEKLVTEWFRSPHLNHGIVISAEDSNNTNLAITSHSENAAHVPFLEVYVTDGKKHRTKRTIGFNCNDSSNETRCCRYPLTVDFEEFGWDWIIAPKKYEANYCSGECPYVFMSRYPHTHILQLSNLPDGEGGPCCAPRKLSSISMLYFDNSMNIIYGTLPAMVVDRCGCA